MKKIVPYRIAGNFRWCKISRKCCIRFRRNFCIIYFRVSMTQQLTTPLSVTLLCRVFRSMKNWPGWQLPSGKTLISSLRTVAQLSLVAFRHRLRRKPWRHARSPQQSFCCLYLPRRIECSSCSEASTRWRSTEIL